MDKLIAIEEMEFDSSTATSANQKVNLEIDPEKYRNYFNYQSDLEFFKFIQRRIF